MSVVADFLVRIVASETVALGLDVTDPTVKHQIERSVRLDGATGVPVTDVFFDKDRALVAGADSIDLTALARGNLPTVNLTGKKVQFFVFHNKGASPMTIAPGATNPYPLFGTGNSVEVKAGRVVAIEGGDLLPDVSGTVKSIDVSGTGTETFDVMIVGG